MSDVRVVQALGVVSKFHVAPPSLDTYNENTCAGVISPSAQDVGDPQEKVVMASLRAKCSGAGVDQVVPALEVTLTRGTPPGPLSMSAQDDALQVSELTPIP